MVTGATSGIGLELARQLADRGYDLIVAAEQDRVNEVAESLQGARTVQADLAEFDGVETLVAASDFVGVPVSVLVINAGVGVGGPFAGESSVREHLNVVNLNVTSAVHLTKRILPRMIERGEGRLLFTSSVAATAPGPYEAVYAASKAFLSSFAEALREELKDTGVTVTALMPGPTDTEFFERAGMQDTKIGSGPKDDPAEVAREGIEAMLAGKDHVVAGSAKNRLQTAAAKVLPDKVSAKAHAKNSEPGSGDN
jgi:uncharacterized protein